MSATAMSLTLSVHNYGTKNVDGYTLTMKTGNGNTVSSHIDTELASLADTTISVTFDPNVYTDDKTSWTVELSGIDNATDCNAGNNTTVPFYTYIKNVVLEEFTTEKCSNCPMAATNIHTLLQEEGYADNVLWWHTTLDTIPTISHLAIKTAKGNMRKKNCYGSTTTLVTLMHRQQW